MKITILFLIYYFSQIIIGVYSQSISYSQTLDLSEPLYFDYDNDNKIFVTNNNEYNLKYYIQGEYIYSLIPHHEVGGEPCIYSCLSWINEVSPKNTIAITGFDVNRLDIYCECKGQILKRKKFQNYPDPDFPYLFKINKYNTRYYYESDSIITKTNRTYFKREYIRPSLIESTIEQNLKNDDYTCYVFLSIIAKNKMAEALTKYKVSCNDSYCECSANLLLSY